MADNRTPRRRITTAEEAARYHEEQARAAEASRRAANEPDPVFPMDDPNYVEPGLVSSAPELALVGGAGMVRGGIGMLRNRAARSQATNITARTGFKAAPKTGPGVGRAASGAATASLAGGLDTNIAQEDRQALIDGGFLPDKREQGSGDGRTTAPAEDPGSIRQRVFTNEDIAARGLPMRSSGDGVPSDPFGVMGGRRDNFAVDAGQPGANQPATPRQRFSQRDMFNLRHQARMDFKQRLNEAKRIKNSVARANAIANVFDQDFLGQNIDAATAAQAPNDTQQAGIRNRIDARDATTREREVGVGAANAEANLMLGESRLLEAANNSINARANLQAANADMERALRSNVQEEGMNSWGYNAQQLSGLALSAAETSAIVAGMPSLMNLPEDQRKAYQERVANRMTAFLGNTQSYLERQYGGTISPAQMRSQVPDFVEAFSIVEGLTLNFEQQAANRGGGLFGGYTPVAAGNREQRTTNLLQQANTPEQVISIIAQLHDASQAEGGFSFQRRQGPLGTGANRIGSGSATEIELQVGNGTQIVRAADIPDEVWNKIPDLYNRLVAQ